MSASNIHVRIPQLILVPLSSGIETPPEADHLVTRQQARLQTLTELHFHVLSYIEAYMETDTWPLAIPDIEKIAKRQSDIAGKTALVHMNSLVLAALLLAQKKTIDLLKEDQKELLNRSMKFSGVFACLESKDPQRTRYVSTRGSRHS